MNKPLRNITPGPKVAQVTLMLKTALSRRVPESQAQQAIQEALTTAYHYTIDFEEVLDYEWQKKSFKQRQKSAPPAAEASTVSLAVSKIGNTTLEFGQFADYPLSGIYRIAPPYLFWFLGRYWNTHPQQRDIILAFLKERL